MTSSGLLTGQTCLVSGIGPGLGRRTALGLARQGGDLFLVSRNTERLAAVADECRALGVRVETMAASITDDKACQGVADAVQATYGHLDVLVNNAFRYDVFQTFSDVDLNQWRKIMDVNLWGTLTLTKALLGSLKASPAASVVMIASMVVRKPQLFEPGYSISKGALVTAMRVLANELGSSGIRVNAVLPGWMWGPSVESYVEITCASGERTREDVIAEITNRIPLGRVPSDEEVAGTVIFLASSLSSAVTGQTIDANGGEVFA